MYLVIKVKQCNNISILIILGSTLGSIHLMANSIDQTDSNYNFLYLYLKSGLTLQPNLRIIIIKSGSVKMDSYQIMEYLIVF